MKWIGIATMALMASVNMNAQTSKNDTMLVDKNYNFVSDIEKAKHKILMEKNDDGTTRILIYSIDGRYQGEENFKHFSYGKQKRIREGRFSKTYFNGNDSLVVIYHDDQAIWPKTLNYPSGKKWIEYKSERTVCPYTDIKEYYESGAIKRVETTVVDEQGNEVTSGKSYDEQGNETEYKPCFVKAVFPGGMENLDAKIQEVLSYPEKFKKSGKEEKVIINITVEKNGYPSSYRYVQASDEAFGIEAVRAVKIATAGRKFKPATLSDRPIKTILVIPVYFKL